MKNNPFKILDITPSADKKMIMRQVTLAMKKREYNPKTIVESQKTLFNPITKAVEEFQYFLMYDFENPVSIREDMKYPPYSEIEKLPEWFIDNGVTDIIARGIERRRIFEPASSWTCTGSKNTE